jgi:hypothetical protein
MPDFSAGSASIKLSPSFIGFVDKARTELKAMDLSVDARIGADTAEATADMERWRTEQAVNPVGIKAEVDRSSTGKASSDLKSLLGDLGSAATLNLKVVGAIGAAGAVSDLLAIADAAAAAGKALALLSPASGFAALAGIGSAAVGASGIAGAFKAQTAASADATASATKQRDALDSISNAEYQVQQANQAHTTSEKNLTQAYQDANRSIRDMNDSLVDQKFATEDAALGVQEAAKNLQKVQYDPAADAITRQRAQLSYAEAIQRYKEQQTKTQDLQQDTAKANAAGVEGSKQVVDAKQAEVSAVHAQQVAVENLAKAQAALTTGDSSQSKLAAALGKLSPNARELVADVKTIGPAWTDARLAAQDALTGGIGPAVEHLAAVQLPNLKSGMVGINTAFNSGLRGVLESLSTDTNKADFKTALDNTASGFANAAQGAKPLTDALTKLVTVGTSEFPQLGTEIDHAAEHFNAFVQQGAAGGSLKKSIDDGIVSLKELAQTAEHVGSSIASVFRAAGDNGSTLKALDDATARMALFLKSAQGQGELGQFFADARGELVKLEPLLQDIPGLLKGLTEGTRLWADISLPFLKLAADLLAAHPHLVETAVAAYLGFKSIKPIVDGASLAVDALAKKTDAAAAKAGGIGKFKAAGQGLLDLLGNPWTIGLAAAATAIVAFESSADRGSAAVTRFRVQAQQAADADRELQKALQTSGGKLDAGVLDAETAGIKGLRDALAANASDAPGLVDKFQEGLTGIGNSLFGIGAGILDNDRIRASADAASTSIGDAFSKAGLSNDQLAQKITGDKPSFDALLDRLSGMGQGGRDAAAKLQGLRDEWAIDSTAVAPVSKAISDLGDKNRDAATAIDAATSAMERQRQGGLTLEDAQLKVNQALTGLGTNAQTASGAVIAANGAIDTTSAKGQELYQLINGNLAPAWEGLTAAAYRDAIQHGQTADAAQAAAQRTSDSIRDSASQQIQNMGYTRDQADALLGHYERLATDFRSTFTTDTSQATKALDDYEKRLDAIRDKSGSIPVFLQLLQPGITGLQNAPSLAPNNANNQPPWWQYTQTPGRADGGPVYGPGTDTSDDIWMRLSNGEYVLKADAVRKYGLAALDALNAETIDPSALQPGAVPVIGAGTTPTAPAIGAGTPATGTPGQVLYPQAALPGRASDAQIQALSARSAVDTANTERNAVYANPASTPQDKQAADIKYQSAQNALESAQNQGQGGLPAKYSLQGIFSQAGSIIATGVLSGLGLDNSILSDSNPYNKAANTLAGQLNIPGGGYGYQPGNLPSVATPTPDLSSLGNYATPGANTGTGSPSIGGPSPAAPQSYNSSGGAEQWRGLAAQILAKEGFDPSQTNVNLTLAQINTESGGNPTAINNWDSNAQAGHPSQGLLQTIPSTFASYRDPSLPNDINDPAANMAAALRYYRARYGNDLSAQWGQGHGYDDGGIADGIGLMLKQTIRPERVLSPAQTETFDSALPLLESINASTWSPSRINQGGLNVAQGGSTASAGHDFSTTIVEPRVADVRDLVDLAERHAQMKAIGLSAAMPK